jgi:hypothetical protein
MADAKPRHTSEELRAISDDIRYECDMEIATATRLLEREEPNGDRVLHNALVESFLIHARQLYQFLYWREPQSTDDKHNFAEKLCQFLCRRRKKGAVDKRNVFAVEYLPEWLEKHCPEDTNMARDGRGDLARLNTEVGTRVAHLTVSRVSDRPYEIHACALALYHAARRFLEVVPPERFTASRELNEPPWAARGYELAEGVTATHTQAEPPESPFKRAF